MRTEAFTGRAKAYAEARPGYPDEAIEYIRTLVPHEAVFADIGAGTGKFTEQIAKYGYEIFAVEPNADMLEQLKITLVPFPNAKIVDGTAEATKIPDHCIDVITSAQALRKFDLDIFRAECIRIGKPNLIVISIWNDGEKISSGYEKTTGAFYRNPNVRKFPNSSYFTRDKWLLYHASMEGVPFEGEEGYEAYTAELNEKFDRDSVDGVLCLNEVTYVYSERIV